MGDKVYRWLIVGISIVLFVDRVDQRARRL
jgi:hypothetical protein